MNKDNVACQCSARQFHTNVKYHRDLSGIGQAIHTANAALTTSHKKAACPIVDKRLSKVQLLCVRRVDLYRLSEQ